MLRFEDEEHLPHSKPEARYHIANDTKYKLNIFQWPDDELANDIAYKVSLFWLMLYYTVLNSVGLVP